MSDKDSLLERAEKQFLKKDYENALKIYSLVLSENPDLKDAKVGVYLSDMGLDGAEEAQTLYSYYQIIKDFSDNADSIIDELLQTFYNTRVIIQEALIEPMEEEMIEDGIFYEDFLKIIEDKGDFKEAFEDIIFSTRVVIRNKSEFIDFITKLAENGFKEMGLSYLDNLADSFENTQEIYKLYELFEER